MQNKLYNMLLDKDEITWRTIILDLVNKEEMDPWNIDISLLANRYGERIKELKKHNFLISGKILLASALLLNLKTKKFLDYHIPDFDNQLFPPDLEELDEFEEYKDKLYGDLDVPPLIMKTPQARRRKVTLKELMKALEKALDIDIRRKERLKDRVFIRKFDLPNTKIDITKLIKDIYNKIVSFFKRKEEVTFTKLVSSDRREDKIQTFLPLLHLENKDKIFLEQKEAFGEIYIQEPRKEE